LAQVLTPIKKLSSRVISNKPRHDVAENDPINKELNEHLDRIDKASTGTVKVARSYYETNKKINIIIVTVGIVLLANSIIYAWMYGVNNWSLFSGGLGITSFVTVFFTKPQENITKALGNLAQMQMITKSYCLQFDIMLDYHIRNESRNIEDVSKVNNILYGITSKAVKLVQAEIETTRKKNSVEQIDQDKKRLVKAERVISEEDSIKKA
jgi:hypothetical protein